MTPLLLLAALAAAQNALEAELGAPPPPVEVPGTADPCPAGMLHVNDFCIDKYEAPNEAGKPPLFAQTAQEGQAWCEERGKRLCTVWEWVRACKGPAEARDYPYGNKHEKGRCVDDKPWKKPDWDKLAGPKDKAQAYAATLYQAEPSGSRPGCVSAEGVADLTGNVAEWVIMKDHKYKHALKGCFWAGCYKNPKPNCGFTNGAHPGEFRTYEAGFRCCIRPGASK